MTERHLYWKLDADNIPREAKSSDQLWKRVAHSEAGGIRVSTVFLGIDHRFNEDGPPILFETMIFGGPHDGFQDRCSTWKEAVAMHINACDLTGLTIHPPHWSEKATR